MLAARGAGTIAAWPPSRFRTLRPGVEVEIRAATDVNELHAAVEAGELDACFSVLPLKDDGPFVASS